MFNLDGLKSKGEGEDVYFSISVNLKTNEVTLFYDDNGEIKKQQTSCSSEYLAGGDLRNNNLQFCVGATYGGSPGEASFSKFDLYACRLYTKVLDEVDVKNNYHESINYRKFLKMNNN